MFMTFQESWSSLNTNHAIEGLCLFCDQMLQLCFENNIGEQSMNIYND